MSHGYNSRWFLSIKSILPVNILPEYEIFNDIESSWNTALQKYGTYGEYPSDIEYHKIFFYLIKDACDNKKLTIKHPFLDKIISSDIYFITHLTSDDDDNFVFNYYFKEKNIVLGLLSGSGITGLCIKFAYIFFSDRNLVYFFEGNESINVKKYAGYFLPKIKNIIKNIDIEKINLEKPLIRTLEGYTYGLGHGLCTYVNGVHIMGQVAIKNEIDELIMGPHDPFLTEKYYKNKYPNINIVKGVLPNEFDSHKIYKGVIFKYGHFHLINKVVDLVKSHIKNVMPISETYENEIKYIKENFYPIFSINLRCVTCEIKDQGLVISDVINKLKNIYPNSFFLIGGFLGDYNEELINKQKCNMATATSSSYNEILNEYQSVFEFIKNNITHKDIKSLINLKINNVLEFVKNVHFCINMNAGYTAIESMLHDIQSLYFGTKWNYHNKKVFFYSKQNFKEQILLEEPDIKFLTKTPGYFGVYEESRVTTEISSDTIVRVVTDYDRENNYILTKNSNK